MKNAKSKVYSAAVVRDEEKIFAAFDTETQGLGGKLLAISAHVMGQTFYWSGPDMVRDFVNLFLTYPSPVVWYAHNAQYDWRYIIPYLIEHEYCVDLGMRTDSDIYQVIVRHENKKFIMRDSFALFSSPPVSLKQLLKQFAPELPKLEIDVENFDPQNPEHIEYSKRDAQGLAVALPRVDAMLKRLFSVGIGHTAAGTAVNAWCRTLPENTYFNSSAWNERELFIRQAYYGGLVFLTRTDKLASKDESPVCETFDVNSSYPSVMRDYGVPTGRALQSRDYETGRMGIYRVRIKTPDDLIVPIIPCRGKRGNMQWRKGTFDTVCTSSELIFACQHGYKVLNLYEGFYFENVEFPFNDFIAKCQGIRKTFKKKPEEALAKLMQNSLYGKFGSKRERLKIFHPTSEADMMGAEPLNGMDYFWFKKELDESMRCLPQWATFITAHARLKILQAVYSVGVENAIYGDTDSITVLHGHSQSINVGEDYGQFKLEKEWKQFRAIAPKVYAGRLMDGTYLGAAKGVSSRAMREHPEKWGELLECGKTDAQALSLASLRVALQTGLPPAKLLRRVSTNIENSSNWNVENHRVSPKMAA